MYTNENSLIKFSRQHSTKTTSDIGESLYDGDLEWDQSDFTRHLYETDALSSYDINEMSEILRNRFLEFDMSSQIGERSVSSRQSTISNLFSSTSNEDLTIQQKYSFHRSLTDFKSLKQQQKYFSLPNIRSISRTSRQSICSIPMSMEIESDSESFKTILYLSKMEIILLYITKLKEKISSIALQTFQSTNTMSIITQDIIDTYDIIQE
jgi:hypothetical protein